MSVTQMYAVWGPTPYGIESWRQAAPLEPDTSFRPSPSKSIVKSSRSPSGSAVGPMLKRTTSGAVPGIWSPGPASGVVLKTAWGGEFTMGIVATVEVATVTVAAQRAVWLPEVTVKAAV